MKWACWLLFCVACATRPPAPAAVASVPGEPPSPREVEIGLKIDRALSRRIGFVGDRRVTAYVERVGRILARFARHRVDFAFRVLDDPAVNAFAAPGGFVYVTRGMLARLSSEAELAAILAHEIGHVDARHSLRDDAWVDERAPAWTQADTLRFYERSRDNEREADAWAARALARAGYDSRALSDALARLAAVELATESSCDADEDAGWLSSHPSTRARIARAEHAASASGGRTGNAAHRAAIEGLAYGEKLRRGRMEGHRWVLADGSVAFELPAGFSAEATGSGFVAADAGSGTVLWLLAAHRDDDGENIGELVSPRWTRVAGHRAVLGELRIDSSEIRGSAALLWIRRELWMLLALGRAGSRWATRMPELLARFHPQTRRRLAAPRRIHLTRLPQATPLSLLAVRAGLSRAELALLNGVSESATLPPGAWVKLVQ